MTSANTMIGQPLRHRHQSFSSSTAGAASERSTQNRKDQREDDDFLEIAGIERGERLDDADHQRRDRGQGIADEPADDRGDKTLQADQESGVVIERRDRHDQDARDRADHRGQQERDLARQRGPDADQPRAEAVDGGGAQRLAVERKAEEQPQRDDEGDGDAIDRDALAGEAQGADRERRVRERRSALALGAEEHQAKALHAPDGSRRRRSAAPAPRCGRSAGTRCDRGTGRSRRRSAATARC